MSEPRLSVCVSTYNRAHLLPRLIAALEAQTYRDFEVVIVDDASTDETAAVLAAMTPTFPFRVISGSVNGGPAVGRNFAWRAAAGRVVAFTDDDCVPSPSWLAAGADAAVPGTYVVGKTEPDPEQLLAEGPFSRTLRINNAKFMQTCNIFYQRDDLERLGGFDARLRTAEDTDLGFRALELGIEGVFAADAVVRHDVRASSWVAAVKDATRWVDVPWVVKRQGHSKYQTWRYFWKPSHRNVFLSLLGLAVGVVLGVVVAPAWFALIAAAYAPWLWRNLTVEGARFSWTRRVLAAPGSYLVDLVEMSTMIRGSVRHKVLLL